MKTYLNADCGSDYIPLMVNIQVKEKQKGEWIMEEILKLIQEKQKMTKGSPEHMVHNKSIKKKCREEKEE